MKALARDTTTQEFPRPHAHVDGRARARLRDVEPAPRGLAHCRRELANHEVDLLLVLGEDLRELPLEHRVTVADYVRRAELVRTDANDVIGFHPAELVPKIERERTVVVQPELRRQRDAEQLLQERKATSGGRSRRKSGSPRKRDR